MKQVAQQRKRHNWNEQCRVQGYSAVGFEKKKYSSREKDSFFFYRSEIQVGLKTNYFLASQGDYWSGCNIKNTFYCK